MKHIACLIWVIARFAAPMPAAEPQPAQAPSALAHPADERETVLVTYRVAPGKEADFLRAVNMHWQILQKLHLVTDAPHTLLRGQEASGETYFVEIFTWVSASIPDHAPAEVRVAWEEFNRLCQSRGGHDAIDISEVEVVGPDV